MAPKGVGSLIGTRSENKTGTGSGSYIRKIPALVLSGIDCCIYSISQIEQQASYESSFVESSRSEIAQENGVEFRKYTSSYTLNSTRRISLIQGVYIPKSGNSVADVGLNYAQWILKASPKTIYHLKTATANIELASLTALNIEIENPRGVFSNANEFSVTISNSSGTNITEVIAGYVNEVEIVENIGRTDFNFINSRGRKDSTYGYTGYTTTTYKFTSTAPFNSLLNRQVIMTRKEKVDGKYKYQFYLGKIATFQTTQDNNWLSLNTDIEPSSNSAGTRYRTQNLPPRIGLTSIEIEVLKRVFTSSDRYNSTDGRPNGTVIVSIRTIGGIEDIIQLALNNGTLTESGDLSSNVVAYLYLGYNPSSDLSSQNDLFEQYAILADGTLRLDKIDKASIYWSKKQSARLESVKYFPAR